MAIMPLQFIYNKWQEDKGIAYTWWQAMHTRIDIILSGHSENSLKNVAYKIEKELKVLEMMGSYFDKSGELYLLNNYKSTSPVLVSNDLYSIIEKCMDYYQRTNGYFDIGIKSDKFDVSAMQYVKLDPENRTISYEKEGIRLDLSGYLKGYALEKIRNILSEHAINDALINMGNSSVMALGNHPHGNGWKIKYNQSTEDDNTEIVLRNECFTTSGNETPGRKHIINPLTGKFAEGKGLVSVITSTGTDGEVLSTALFAAGKENHHQILSNFPDTTII